MPSSGLDPDTGKILVGFDRVKRSIERIVTTAYGERVERRDYGCGSLSLLDRPGNADTIADFHMALTEALRPRLVRGYWYGEPCWNLTLISIVPSETGLTEVRTYGDYIEDGHLQNYNSVERGLVVQVPLAP